jgi:hypothetical protein
MQHAVHNRATVRVADRTDVSGRLTASQSMTGPVLKGKVVCGASPIGRRVP